MPNPFFDVTNELTIDYDERTESYLLWPFGRFPGAVHFTVTTRDFTPQGIVPYVAVSLGDVPMDVDWVEKWWECLEKALTIAHLEQTRQGDPDFHSVARVHRFQVVEVITAMARAKEVIMEMMVGKKAAPPMLEIMESFLDDYTSVILDKMADMKQMKLPRSQDKPQ